MVIQSNAAQYRLVRLCLLSLVVWFLILSLIRQGGVLLSDDFFIHFRIANHWLSTGQPFFNLDEPVLGTSSPLYVALLVSVLTLFGKGWFEGLLFLQSAFITVLFFCAFFLVRRSGQSSIAASLAGVFAVLTSIESALLGMETPLALVLMLLSLLLLSRYPSVALAIGAASIGVRLECVIFFSLLVGYLFLAREYRLRLLSASALYLAMMLGAVWFAFGTIIPHPAIAKALVYALSRDDFSAVLERLFSVYPDSAGEANSTFFPFFLCLAILFSLGLAIFSRRAMSTPVARTTTILLSFSILVAGGYLAKLVLVFPWYVPLVLTPLVISASLLLGVAPGWKGRVLALSVMVLASFYPAISFFAVYDSDLVSARELEAGRTSRLIEIGDRINGCGLTYIALAAEIGGIGAGYLGTVRDGVGLVSPRALVFHPVAGERAGGYHGAVPLGYVREVDPDVVVTLSHLLEAGAADALKEDYQFIREPVFLGGDTRVGLRRSIWGSHEILILVKSSELFDCVKKARATDVAPKDLLRKLSIGANRQYFVSR